MKKLIGKLFHKARFFIRYARPNFDEFKDLPAYDCSWCVNEGVDQIAIVELERAKRGEITRLPTFGEILIELNKRYHQPDSMPHPYEYRQPF